MSHALLDDLLRRLESERLRRIVELPLLDAREQFVARFVSTTSHDEFIDEIARFVDHMHKSWLSVDIDLPPDIADSRARDLLKATFGGEMEAMKLVRHGDSGGMRGLLDKITAVLQRQALGQYLTACVLPDIVALDAESSMRLAASYLDEYRSAWNTDLENPAMVAARWEEVIHRHAQIVLHGKA